MVLPAQVLRVEDIVDYIDWEVADLSYTLLFVVLLLSPSHVLLLLLELQTLSA